MGGGGGWWREGYGGWGGGKRRGERGDWRRPLESRDTAMPLVVAIAAQTCPGDTITVSNHVIVHARLDACSKDTKPISHPTGLSSANGKGFIYLGD